MTAMTAVAEWEDLVERLAIQAESKVRPSVEQLRRLRELEDIITKQKLPVPEGYVQPGGTNAVGRDGREQRR